MTRIILGFVDDTENDDFDFIQAVPSKIGGLPKWLTLSNVPARGVIICPKCSNVMPLLLQIYAPLDINEYSYHRMIYVFCCRNGSCHKARSSIPFKVLRSNTKDTNCNFKGPNKDPAMLERELLKHNDVELCTTCGVKVESFDSYCCKKHEVIHKLMEEAKNHHRNSFFSFPVYEIVVEEYDSNVKSKHNKNLYSLEKKLLEQYEKNNSLIDDNDDELDKVAQSLLQDDHKFHEKTFEHFRDSMSDYPDQILRYSLNGPPLLASSHPLPTIPVCKNCNAPLQFEFQIMPQLINYLYPEQMISNTTRFKPEDFLEWGTLLIYTCSKSCLSADGSYLEEFIIKQDYD